MDDDQWHSQGARIRNSYAHLVVVTSPEINHDMLVTSGSKYTGREEEGKGSRCSPVEEHDRTWVVQLVHLAHDP